jgi:hypothetical protein
MERDVHFYSKPGSPRWKLSVDENTHYMGVGNVLKDKKYFSLLSKQLLSEGIAFEEIMERPQFNSVEKPILMQIDSDSMGDKVTVLKPGYVERQEVIGTILQFLVDNTIISERSQK